MHSCEQQQIVAPVDRMVRQSVKCPGYKEPNSPRCTYVRFLSLFACGSSVREYVSCTVVCTCLGCFLKNEFNLHSWLRAIYCSRSCAHVVIVCCREALKSLRENGCSRSVEHCVGVGLAVIFSSLCLAYWGGLEECLRGLLLRPPPPPFWCQRIE